MHPPFCVSVKELKRERGLAFYRLAPCLTADNRGAIAIFCATYNVEEKRVVNYLGHLSDIDIRKEIRTRDTKERGVSHVDDRLSRFHIYREGC